jgi:hypothetical protein
MPDGIEAWPPSYRRAAMHLYFFDQAYRHFHGDASIPELAMLLGLLGAIAWIVAYVIFIVTARRDRASAMPMVAVCLNVTWEFTYAFIWPPKTPVMMAIRIVWLLLDLVILAHVIRFGARDFPDIVARHFRFIVFATLVLSFATHIAFADSFNALDATDPHNDGYYEAYLLNLVMSILFCAFFLKREQSPDGMSTSARPPKGISRSGGFVKLIGTLLYAIANILIYIYRGHLVDGLLPPLLFVSIFAFDVLYLALIMNSTMKSVAIAATRREPSVHTVGR